MLEESAQSPSPNGFLKMPDPIKHHFLPVFYLKRWCGDDGRLVEFSVPFKTEVKPKRVHPKGTGYIDKLYAVEGLSGHVSHAVEKSFLSPVDSRASSVLKALVGKVEIGPKDRKSWSHFVMTLLMRTPAEILLLKDIIRRIDAEISRSLFDMFSRHVPADYHSLLSESFGEYKESTLSRSVDYILRVMSSDDIIDRIARMEWDLFDLSAALNELLTSDRPIVVVRNDRTAGNTVIALPVGPRELFVAATSRSLIRELRKIGPRRVAEAMNMDVVAGANRLVYGSSDRQLTFVQNRFGMSKTPSFVTEILRSAGANAEQITGLFSRFDDDDIRDKIREVLSSHRARTSSMATPE